MKLKTKIFELSEGKYKSLRQLALAMGIHPSLICRVKRGQRGINKTFIIGAIKAFPGYKLNDLFYVAPEESENDFRGK